jgi:hypothetical protein
MFPFKFINGAIETEAHVRITKPDNRREQAVKAKSSKSKIQ